MKKQMPPAQSDFTRSNSCVVNGALIAFRQEDFVISHAAALVYDAVDGEDRSLPDENTLSLKAHQFRSRRAKQPCGILWWFVSKDWYNDIRTNVHLLSIHGHLHTSTYLEIHRIPHVIACFMSKELNGGLNKVNSKLKAEWTKRLEALRNVAHEQPVSNSGSRVKLLPCLLGWFGSYWFGRCVGCSSNSFWNLTGATASPMGGVQIQSISTCQMSQRWDVHPPRCWQSISSTCCPSFSIWDCDI